VTTPGGRALRLTFRYEGDRVELVSSQPVEMLLPPSHAVDEGEGQSGFWFTLRAADDRPVYRRVTHSPIRRDVEVFSPEPGENIRRVPVDRPSGTFVLLVPDVEDARVLTLHDSAGEARALAGPAREIARFELRRAG